MKIRRIILLLAVLLTSPAMSQVIFDSPNGLWVAPSTYNGTLYGASNSAADWHVTQWNTPANDLPKFLNNRVQNANQRAVVHPNFHEIAQTGVRVNCGLEFGAYVGTNKSNVYPAHTTAGTESVPLSQMAELKHSFSLYPKFNYIHNTNRCALNIGGHLTAVVFKNTSTNHVFFYQLRLSNYGFTGSPVWWNGWNGPAWGFGDELSAYNASAASNGNWNSYNIDILPRIKQLLNNQMGQQDFDNWVVSASYHGSHTWGDVTLTGYWKNVKLEYQ